jgi:hypothetical protein
MESRTVAQRAIGGTKRPVRSKRDRGETTKQAADDGAEIGLLKQTSETLSPRDEDPFASLTANLVQRERGAELHKSSFLNSTAGLLVHKGEAKPSTIVTPPTEATDQSNAMVPRDQAEREIRSLRDELAALRSTLAQREAALQRAAVEQGQSRERQEQGAAQATRLADVEAEWRERSESALAEVRAGAEAARGQAEIELQSLRDELAALRATFADHDSALAQASLEQERARERQRQENQKALSEAEQVWRTAEAARVANIEAGWQEKSARALADVRAKADTARIQSDEEIRALRDDLAALRSALAERETTLASAAVEHKRRQQESENAISKAEQAWKAAEASRFAHTETEWRERSEKALAEMRAGAEAVSRRAERELQSLRDDLAAGRSTLADREIALAKAISDIEQERKRGRQELEAVLAKAKAWEAGEAARLAAAETEWRSQSAKALNDATARYQAAEGMLTQVRMQTDRARSDAIGGSIKANNRTRFGTKTADREADAAPINLPTKDERGPGTQGTMAAFRSNQMMTPEPEPHAKKRGTLRDVALAASVAILAIVAYPFIAPFLPPSWQSNIVAITGGSGPSTRKSSPPPMPAPPVSASNAATQSLAVVDREVNLRVGPSTAEKVMAALPRGSKVTPIEQRGDWTLVQIDGGNAQPRRGWVYSSFLKEEARGIEKALPKAAQ